MLRLSDHNLAVGLTCGDQRRRTGSGSALRDVYSDTTQLN